MHSTLIARWSSVNVNCWEKQGKKTLAKRYKMRYTDAKDKDYPIYMKKVFFFDSFFTMQVRDKEW